MTQVNYFEQQPDETIFRIFQFLDSESLENCFGVDKRFNAISKDLQLWKMLFPSTDREAFLKRIKSGPQLLKLIKNTFMEAPFKKTTRITVLLPPNSYIKISYCLGHHIEAIKQQQPHQDIVRLVDKKNPFLDPTPKSYVFHSSGTNYYRLTGITSAFVPITVAVDQSLDETVVNKVGLLYPKIFKVFEKITDENDKKIIDLFSLTVVPIIAIAARYFVYNIS